MFVEISNIIKFFRVLLNNEFQMKKIIMIAMYFPPAEGVATFRITKFVKYLGGVGWSPIVITLNEDAYSNNLISMDNSLMSDIPSDSKIVRTNVSKPIIFRKILSNVTDINWLPKLIYSLVVEIKNERPEVIYATIGPGFPSVAALIVKLIYGIPYVIDFRDLWKGEKIANPRKNITGRIYRGLINVIEPMVVNNASKIICVSDGMENVLKKAYPKRAIEDFVVIPNGYDPCDYEKVKSKKFTHFTIIYAGKFLSEPYFRNPKYFFEALRLVNESNIPVKFRHIGKINEEVVQLAKNCFAYEFCEFVGTLSYTNTIENMKGADLLLLIGSGDNIEQTGKIFDYLGCKKPVLALANNLGGIADVVRELDHVKLIENGNAQLIAHAIKDIYHSSESILVNDSQLKKYHRSSLTRQLGDLLDTVIASKDARATS